MKIILTLCGVLLCGMLTMPVARAEGMPGAPTVLVPTVSIHSSSVKPVIAGVTKTGTQVDVYIDSQFNGRATIATAVGAIASWSYTPFLNLSHGWHSVSVKAQTASGERSLASTPVNFFIDLLVPTPTLLTPVVNADTTQSKPWIVGLSKGGMTLDVWIDGVLNGQVVVDGEKSQVVSFKYQPFLPLKQGAHTLAVVAHDSQGGKSRPADLDFTVYVALPASETLSTVSTTSTVITQAPDTLPSQQLVAPLTQDQAANTNTAEANTNQEAASETAETTTEANINGGDEPVVEHTNAAASAVTTDPDQNRTNILSTIGWVLLALVAVGIISRGRSQKPADQLVKIDTSDSTPFVEVIRKPENNTPPNSPTPPAPPVA